MQLPESRPSFAPCGLSACLVIEAPEGGLLGALVTAFVRAEFPGVALRLVASPASEIVTVRAEGHAPKMFVFPADPDPVTIARLASVGQHSLVSLGSTLNDLREAMDRMMSGDTPFLSHSLVQILAAASLRNSSNPRCALLTHREMEVLRLLTLGFSNQELADNLSVSTNTVRAHLQAISGKLGVTGRTRVIARSRELGVLFDHS